MGGFFEQLSDAELRRQFDTNFFGLASVTRAVAPGMRERRKGRIINMSSMSTVLPAPGLSGYIATKWAIEGLSEVLRLELAPFGIDVIIMEPGTYKTDIFGRNRQIAERALDPASPYAAATAKIKAYSEHYVARHGRDPREVAEAVCRVATVRRPRLRYRVGRGETTLALLRLLVPWRIYQRTVERFLAGTLDQVSKR
jgi:NAD(P)-dependent dehydrogenase (short-subunit alcohol dehydrogenase family)